MLESGDYLIKPQDDSLHQEYTFYMRVTAYGGSQSFFGPYTLRVGCFGGVVTYSDSPSFSNTAPTKNVGDSTSSVYTFVDPVATKAYCSI